MLLFRSEEHVEEWVRAGHGRKGGFLTLDQLWGLASSWYRNRMEAGWRRPTPDEARDLFDSLGLTGGFWRLR
ncbi:MAG: hypothetical protein ACRDKA_11560 [Actinomycetota bacterium]